MKMNYRLPLWDTNAKITKVTEDTKDINAGTTKEKGTNAGAAKDEHTNEKDAKDTNAGITMLSWIASSLFKDLMWTEVKTQ